MLSPVPIDPADLDPDPIAQLRRWLAEAAVGHDLPETFALATASAKGEPSVRFVLLRGLDAEGLRFYTNRLSRKGRDLATNPLAAAAFWWPGLGRQARVSGTVRALSDEESTDYWLTRPRASRLAAWASEQGQPIDTRAGLEARVAEVDGRYSDVEPPLPPFWGGYLLRPEVVELWESRADRLHDRVEYVRAGATGWRRRRLQP